MNIRLLKLVSIVLTIFLIGGCPQNNDCIINFFISGTVTDQSSNPLVGVDIYSHDTNPLSASPTKWATSDSQGKYSFFRGSYSDIGTEYIFFRKSGYQDLTTPIIGKGNGTCGDQQIVRDGVMVP